MVKANGQFFAGWGFMRFWESDEKVRGSTLHMGMSGKDGNGNAADHHGAIKPESWRFPTRDSLSHLDATPRSVEDFR